MAEFLQQCGSWGVLATLAAYAAGVWVNRKTGKALFNPLLMGSIFMIVFLSCFGVPYADYKSSAQPVSWLLMPATVSLRSRCMKSGSCWKRTWPRFLRRLPRAC